MPAADSTFGSSGAHQGKDRPLICLPPPEMRLKVCSTTDRLEYVKIGAATAASLENLLARHGIDIGSLDRILDFACGCGRALNFLRHRVGSERLYGCDYDEEQVQWCRRNLSLGGFERNGELPPSSFPEGFFDLICAISFFTHLDQAAQESWLSEWKRILKPDGWIVLTLHGRLWARHEKLKLPLSGFLHRSDGPAFNQQVTFQTPRYVRRHWNRDFRILEHDELGLVRHQDLVLLTPRGSNPRSRAPIVPTLPKALLDCRRRRPDLQEDFLENGLGRQGTNWHNVSLREWALFFGCGEAPEAAPFGYEALFQEVQT